ncbi:MAG: hypothetical protein U1E51_12105, partial [Candidatus Binatia bacterium]|nr:hypothetical protein [Candidatus Binatia bacterium]
MQFDGEVASFLSLPTNESVSSPINGKTPMTTARSGQPTAKERLSFENQKSDLRGNQALLLVSASEGDANMLYATGFFVPDPFIFFQHKQKKYVVMSDLEIDRAKKQA